MRVALSVIALFALLTSPVYAEEKKREPSELEIWMADPIPASATEADFKKASDLGFGEDLSDLEFYMPSMRYPADGATLARGDTLLRVKVRPAKTGVLTNEINPRGLLALTAKSLPVGTPVYAIKLGEKSEQAWCTPVDMKGMIGAYTVSQCMLASSRMLAVSDAGTSASTFPNTFNHPMGSNALPQVEEKRVTFEGGLSLLIVFNKMTGKQIEIERYVADKHGVSILKDREVPLSSAGDVRISIAGKSLTLAKSAAPNSARVMLDPGYATFTPHP